MTHKSRESLDEQQRQLQGIMPAEELRKEIVKLSQDYHNLGMTYTDFVEEIDNLISQYKKHWLKVFSVYINGRQEYPITEKSIENFLNF